MLGMRASILIPGAPQKISIVKTLVEEHVPIQSQILKNIVGFFFPFCINTTNSPLSLTEDKESSKS